MNTHPERIAFAKGYRVSPDGQTVTSRRGYVRKLCKKNGEYRVVTVSIHRRVYPVMVHRLQAYQHFGEAIFAAECVRHLDGNPANNAVGNLALGTASENMMDIPADIRLSKARIASAAATKHDHAEVLEFYRATKSYAKTMRKFGISSKGTISFIVRKSEAGKRYPTS
jgi:hypothetical protein